MDIRRIRSRVAAAILAAAGLVAAGGGEAAPFAYVPETSGNMSVIDVATQTVVATVPGLGGNPGGTAVDPSGAFVYSGDISFGRVYVISTSSNTISRFYQLPGTAVGVAIDPAGTRLFAVDRLSRALMVLDPATGSVIASISTGPTSNPWGVAVNPAGTRAYVTDTNANRVYVIDAVNNVVLTSIVVGTMPYDVAVDPTGTRVYVTNQNSGTVSVIDAAADTVVATLTTGGLNYGIAISPDGSRGYVANRSANTVVVFDLTTNTGITTIPVGTFPIGVSLDPSGSLAYVTNVSSNTVSVIDTATNTVVATVPVGTGPATFGKFVGGAAATAPAVTLSPASLSFGNQTLGTTSALQSVTLTNSGTATLNISGVTVTGDFSIASTCGATLAAGSSCGIDVRFTPLVAGARTGQVSVASDAAGSPHSVSLDGTGVVPPSPVAAVSPASLNFSATPVGSTSSLGATFTNGGGSTLAIRSLTLAGQGFGLGHNCGTSLAPGASCSLLVSFSPTATGNYSGQLQVASNAPSSPTVVAVSGVATTVPSSQLTAPSILYFPDQVVGTVSAGQPLTLVNDGTARVAISRIQVSGEYRLEGESACGTLEPGASCTFTVFFAPSGEGERGGEVDVSSSASNSFVGVRLYGRGAAAPAPIAVVSATTLGFGNAFVLDHLSLPLGVANRGSAPLRVSSMEASREFRVVGGCADAIAPGEACAFHVEFVPAIPGAHSGVLRIETNASPLPLEVRLSGQGCWRFSYGFRNTGQPSCGP